MQSYRIDHEGEDGKTVVQYFDDNRGKAINAARRLSRKGLTVYMIRAEGDYGQGFDDKGQIVFAEGRIIDRDGEAA